MDSVRCVPPAFVDFHNTRYSTHNGAQLSSYMIRFHHTGQKSMHGSHFTPERDHRGGWVWGAGRSATGNKEGDGGLMV